ncbi:hypothetical protein [Streptomyces sp. NPDC048639]
MADIGRLTYRESTARKGLLDGQKELLRPRDELIDNNAPPVSV